MRCLGGFVAWYQTRFELLSFITLIDYSPLIGVVYEALI